MTKACRGFIWPAWAYPCVPISEEDTASTRLFYKLSQEKGLQVRVGSISSVSAQIVPLSRTQAIRLNMMWNMKKLEFWTIRHKTKYTIDETNTPKYNTTVPQYSLAAGNIHFGLTVLTSKTWTCTSIWFRLFWIIWDAPLEFVLEPPPSFKFASSSWSCCTVCKCNLSISTNWAQWQGTIKVTELNRF